MSFLKALLWAGLFPQLFCQGSPKGLQVSAVKSMAAIQNNHPGFDLPAPKLHCHWTATCDTSNSNQSFNSEDNFLVLLYPGYQPWFSAAGGGVFLLTWRIFAVNLK